MPSSAKLKDKNNLTLYYIISCRFILMMCVPMMILQNIILSLNVDASNGRLCPYIFGTCQKADFFLPKSYIIWLNSFELMCKKLKK